MRHWWGEERRRDREDRERVGPYARYANRYGPDDDERAWRRRIDAFYEAREGEDRSRLDRTNGYRGTAQRRYDDRESYRQGVGWAGGPYGGDDPGYGVGHAGGAWSGYDESRASPTWQGERNFDPDDRQERGWFDRAGDEIRSWFGDEQADARRRFDMHRGRGPKGYSRSDDRIREDVCDRLTEDPRLDASDVEVQVDRGEVTLTGTVFDRSSKRRAEDCADAVMGVTNVQNNLRARAFDQAGGAH
ncbi:osmotic sensory protein [Sphingomonas sp. DBB INV C78]|uniref:BON domain-containing protein n=1 Tax=Sphingomonas sp. DBB INV C78 TaxID=3349434 RepID=UPI0036D3443E